MLALLHTRIHSCSKCLKSSCQAYSRLNVTRSRHQQPIPCSRCPDRPAKAHAAWQQSATQPEASQLPPGLLLNPDHLLQAISSAAARQRQQQQQQLRELQEQLLRQRQQSQRGQQREQRQPPPQQPSGPSEADLMFLDVAFASTLAGLKTGAFDGGQLIRLASDMATLAQPTTLATAGGLPQGWGEALAGAMQNELLRMPGAALAPAITALQGLGVDPGPEWLAALLQRSEQCSESLSARDMSCLLASIAALGYRPHDAWLELMCARSLYLGLDKFQGEELADFAAALAACGYCPPDAWLDALVYGALLEEPEFAMLATADAARLLWAICSFQVLPHPGWLSACYTQILVDIETLSPEWLCKLLWCIGSMEVARPRSQAEGPTGQEDGGDVSFRPPASWLQLLMQLCVPHVRSLGSIQLVKVLWAAAALRLRPPPTLLVPLVERTRQLLTNPSAATSATQAKQQPTQPSLVQQQQREFEPLEVLYLARCSDTLYDSLSAGMDSSNTRPGARGGAGLANEPPGSQHDAPRGEPDEYDRLGPPPPLALLVRDAYQAVSQLAATSRMPPEWRKINVWYPPYAMSQAPGSDALGEEEDSGQFQPTQAGQAAPYGPTPPPGMHQRRR